MLGYFTAYPFGRGPTAAARPAAEANALQWHQYVYCLSPFTTPYIAFSVRLTATNLDVMLARAARSAMAARPAAVTVV